MTVISKLTVQRHFGMLDEIPDTDIPWSMKKDGGIFRGALTGMKRNGFRVVKKSVTETQKDLCLQIQRCKFVYEHSDAKLVNASLVGVVASHPNNLLRGPVVPEVLDGVRLYGPRLSLSDLLEYKAIIMLEGNDVSSGYDESSGVS